MQIEIKIDETCKDTKIIVVTDKVTDEINSMIKKLSDEQSSMLAGFKDDIVEILEPNDIYRIFVWFTQYFVWKYKIQKMNDRVKKDSSIK